VNVCPLVGDCADVYLVNADAWSIQDVADLALKDPIDWFQYVDFALLRISQPSSAPFRRSILIMVEWPLHFSVSISVKWCVAFLPNWGRSR
jgi:hypothetical protein